MKKITLLMGIVLMPIFIFHAQVVSGRFSSSVYTFERAFDTSNSQIYVRGYQQLQLNAAYKAFAIRSSFNLENSYSGTLDSDPRLRVYNLYLEARNLFKVLTLRVGRLPVFNGIASGVYDGASVKASYSGVELDAAYGGILPAYQKLDFKDINKNNVAAVKLSGHFLNAYSISAGYSRKNFKPEEYWALRIDEKFNPVMMLIQKNSQQFEYLHGGVTWAPENCNHSAYLKYEYDLGIQATSKIEAETELGVMKNLDVSLYGNYREPRVRYNSIFSVFDFGNTVEGEAGVTYRLGKVNAVSAKFGYVNYKDENSSRLNLGYSFAFGSVGYRKTFGYAGEMDAVSANAAHAFFNGKITPSCGVSYTNYKLSKNDPSSSLFSLLAGVNYRPYKSLSLDGQIQIINNKIYQNDVRMLLKLNYWFNKVF